MSHLLPTPLPNPRIPARLPVITVGLDGSRESLASVTWAADEARRRGLSLRVLHVWSLDPDVHSPLIGSRTRQGMTEPDPRTTAEWIRGTHRGLEVHTQQRCGEPAAVLCEAAEESELLVVGSRGLGGFTGFIVGSVALSVVARTRHPVVLVPGPEPMPGGDVVLGVDLSHPCDEVLDYAFSQAHRLGVPLRVVHSPHRPGGSGGDAEEAAAAMAPGTAASATARTLTQVINQWRHAFPGLHVTGEIRPGHPARRLLEAAHSAGLVVIGRRNRDSRLGPHTGTVTRAVLHRCRTPVAVIPHD
ncbi:universal stress protein [Streptomyces antarcticus]|uniref:universal stress protein n=1 Tax=Streptomyces antarcticus TaxID=2996458 RepID=UPI00226EF831|nr:MULTISPECIES: universal stress protein [unclassified Streptomyces]MCY0944494.1 universal stress protein [Streptomyces sp. H34-AA3]MCZ4084523.1 universal stress protein [Streptomyces sp. H34-S5]